MRTRTLIAAALAAAVVALVGWQTRTPHVPHATVAPRPTAAPPAPPRPPSLPPANPAPGIELTASLDDTRARLAAAAKPCWAARPEIETPTNEPDDTIGELRFRYSLITDGSEARVDGLTIYRDTIRDRPFRDCIERALAAARWRSAAAPARTAVNDLLRVGDLTRRDPPVER